MSTSVIGSFGIRVVDTVFVGARHVLPLRIPPEILLSRVIKLPDNCPNHFGGNVHRIPVREIMSTPIITINPEALVADAAERMEQNTIRRLPVVDEDGCLLGIVTDSDVLEAETAETVLSSYEPGIEDEWLEVKDVMTRDPITIGPDFTVGELAIRLMKHKVGGVPVVVPLEPGATEPCSMQVLGIVTETDIFRLIADAWRAENP